MKKNELLFSPSPMFVSFATFELTPTTRYKPCSSKPESKHIYTLYHGSKGYIRAKDSEYEWIAS